MPNFKELRGRLQGLYTTQKITSAMKVVASTKFKKLQKNSTHVFEYLGQLCLLEDFVVQKFNYESEKKLLIVCIGDRGLCGPYNQRVFKRLKEIYGDYDHIGYVGWKFDLKINTLFRIRMADVLNTDQWGDVAQRFYDYSEIDILHTQFNTVSDQPVVLNNIRKLEHTSKQYILNESTIDHTGTLLLAGIWQAAWQAQLCEFSTRMVSMDNATRNANDMIKDLRLKCNKLRQSMITKELSEIVAGVDT